MAALDQRGGDEDRDEPLLPDQTSRCRTCDAGQRDKRKRFERQRRHGAEGRDGNDRPYQVHRRDRGRHETGCKHASDIGH